MGIHQLMNLIKEKAPNCFRTVMLDYFAGKMVGCDASMAMYQFLIQTQGYQDGAIVQLTDKEGNHTGHLLGLFNRTIQFLENGVKPVWVFDGKPPLLKSGELAKRKKQKEEAAEKTEQALQEGNMQEALMYNQRNTKITKQMKDDAIKMLQLMGCPVVIAPCEAEAQCAALCKAGKIYATATEDMDALTFQTPILLRGFNTKKEPIFEINFQDMLTELNLSYEQFVDMCILCGCDYTEKIEGIGPGKAYKFIQEYKNIEEILKQIEKENNVKLSQGGTVKYTVPKKFLYEDSRELFANAQVQDPKEIDLTFNKPDIDALKKFLCEEKGFAETRVDNAMKKMAASDKKGHQSRLEAFFGKPTKILAPKPEKGKASDKKKPGKSENKKKKI